MLAVCIEITVMTTTPTASVVIAAYNAERWLGRAVASVMDDQGVGPVEVVIVDDRSSDATASVVEALQAEHPGVRLIRNDRNLGPAGSRNRGLDAAMGRWVAVLDADDAFAPGRLRRLIDVATERDLQVIADLPLMYDLHADQPATSQLEASGGFSRIGVVDLLRVDPETGLDLGMLKPIYRDDLVKARKVRYPESIRHGEDFSLYVELARAGVRIGLLREPHYLFSSRVGEVSGRFSPGSVTQVDFVAVAAQSRALLEDMRQHGDLTPEAESLLLERIERLGRANRMYGWMVLRMGSWRRLARWLRKAENRRDFRRVLSQKLAGKRGHPD